MQSNSYLAPHSPSIPPGSPGWIWTHLDHKSLETTFFRLPMGMLWFTRWLNFVHELLIVAVLFWSSRIMYTESIMLWLHHLTRKLLLRDAILFQRDVSLIILPFPRCFCDSKTESKCLDLSLVFESRSTVYEVLLQRFCRNETYHTRMI